MKLVREHINEKFTEDSDPIHDFRIGMDELIKRWIEKETDYSYSKGDLLWICAKHGKIEFVKYLLNKGYDVHENNDLVLQAASVRGHTEIVKVLLNAGADVHANDDGALRYASQNGHIETVKVLLDAGADVHASGYSLQWASEGGHVETVKVLLNAGADVHANNDYALYWATKKGHTETVKVLKDWIAKEKKKVNEKFTDDDSDPIHDMGIGFYSHRNFTDETKFIDFLLEYIPLILKTPEIPEDILHGGGLINREMFRIIQQYLRKYVTFNHMEIGHERCQVFTWPRMLKNKLESMGFK